MKKIKKISRKVGLYSAIGLDYFYQRVCYFKVEQRERRIIYINNPPYIIIENKYYLFSHFTLCISPVSRKAL